MKMKIHMLQKALFGVIILGFALSGVGGIGMLTVAAAPVYHCQTSAGKVTYADSTAQLEGCRELAFNLPEEPLRTKNPDAPGSAPEAPSAMYEEFEKDYEDDYRSRFNGERDSEFYPSSEPESEFQENAEEEI